MKNVVPISGGKDSTAVLHLLLEQGVHIDEVVCFECDWDFPEMANQLRLIEQNTNISIVRIRSYRYFNELLRRWGWPHPSGGWCVDCKYKACNQFFRAVKGEVEYIGFSVDEKHRTERPYIKKKKWEVRYPLIELGMTGADALAYCYSLGYHWDGLYDIFNRVSCFCCPKAGKKRIEKLKAYRSDLYAHYLMLDRIAQSRSQTVE